MSARAHFVGPANGYAETACGRSPYRLRRVTEAHQVTCPECAAAMARTPAPSTTPDADKRAFWCAAFCAAMRPDPDDGHTIVDLQAFAAGAAKDAATHADAALVEYRKRWGAR